MLDFHNHLIPGVDDGAESLEESLDGLEKMRAQGITHVITTPHFQASLLGRPAQLEAAMAAIDAGWRKLASAAREAFPDLVLGRGLELALDEPIGSVDDARVRLNGSSFVLVEFPYFTIPPQSGVALARLKAGGVIPIVAHPERYRNLDDEMEILRAWKQAGAFLQVNAGSIVGAYGARVERIAWQCLRAGLIDYMCSDFHARGRCLIELARQRFVTRGGQSQLNALLEYNGDRLLLGLEPTPVAPFGGPQTRWQNVRRLLGWR